MKGLPNTTTSRALYILGLVILLCALESGAEEARPQHLIVFLPSEDVTLSSLPSDGFIKIMRETGQACLRAGGNVEVSVVTDNVTAAKYARIILVSYGIFEDRVRIVKSPSDVEDAGATSAIRIGIPNRSATRKAPTRTASPRVHFKQAFVVLGNRPLDDSTPTVDMVQRILTAIEYARPYGRSAVFILTGAATEGTVSEARMMALIALSRGVPASQLILEEESWTTGRNAFYSAPIIARLGIKKVFVVTKRTHHEFAWEYLSKYPEFKHATPVISPGAKEETLAQMIDYLKRHDDQLVRQRIVAIKNGASGID